MRLYKSDFSFLFFKFFFFLKKKSGEVVVMVSETRERRGYDKSKVIIEPSQIRC